MQRLCRVLGTSRSGYYKHLITEPARIERQAEEAATVAEIRAIHTEHRSAYGAPRVHAVLRSRGRRINRKRVAEADANPPCRGSAPAPHRAHDHRGHVGSTGPGSVVQDFTATAVDTKWCGDLTYIPVGSSWLFLATVIDICSRRVVGWSIADHMRTELVTDAIEMAVRTRGGDVGGVTFRSDADHSTPQQLSSTYAAVMGSARVEDGSARVTDNALAESFFQGLKREWLHGRSRTSQSHARLDLFEWLSYHNRQRRHSALGYLTPVEFEQRLIASSTLSVAA
ncbi:IS3 family transposase [Rhodococcus jostii]|uniref:IS3 family transposase n=1 Tax=Rhodococcus jostii TaxID=132919 RepID=UPI00362EDA1B